MDLIKDNDEVINVGVLIEKLKEHKDKELFIHIWIEGEKDKFLVGNPSIYGDLDDDNDIFNLTIVFDEEELEVDEEELEIDEEKSTLELKLIELNKESELTEEEKKAIQRGKHLIKLYETKQEQKKRSEQK